MRLTGKGLVILDDCEVIRYVGTNPDGVGGGHAPLDSPGADPHEPDPHDPHGPDR